jgi:peptidoglycan/LPS O-acetylase OafA/YrhL
MSFVNEDGRDLTTQNMLNTEDEYDQSGKSQILGNNLAPKKEKERAYYADWIRALSIHFVIMVHCVQLNMEATDISSPETYARVPYNEEIVEKARGFIKSLVQIGIPIFFYISGMSLTYYDTQKKGFVVYLKSKFIRLIVPFFVALIVILVPRLYLA